MREPIVGHELNPKGRQNIKDGCFLIITVGFRNVARQPVSVMAIIVRRLGTAKEFAADHLGIGLQQAQPIAVAVYHNVVFAKIGEGGIERDVSGEGLTGGAHQGIRDVVAYAGQIAEAYQFSSTLLRTIATDGYVSEMSTGETQLRPYSDGGSRRSISPPNVFLEGFTVIE